MHKLRFLLIGLVLACCLACKQQPAAASSAPPEAAEPAPAPTDFSYLEQYSFKPYLEGVDASAPFQDRLKRLTGKAYSTIVEAMQKGNPQGILSDGLWYSLFAEYEMDGVRYQSTIVADLPKNNLAAGHWNDKTDKVTHFIENAEKVPPPFQAWLDDSN